MASLLYDNKRVLHSKDGSNKTDTIMPIGSTSRASHISPMSTMSDYHSRSSSFSHYRPSVCSIDGSTTSLPASAVSVYIKLQSLLSMFIYLLMSCTYKYHVHLLCLFLCLFEGHSKEKSLSHFFKETNQSVLLPILL